MELKTTVDKVKEAAETCPEAKVVLEKLFPSVFAPENWNRKLVADGFRTGIVFITGAVADALIQEYYPHNASNYQAVVLGNTGERLYCYFSLAGLQQHWKLK
jgi:hypothetical protein